MYQVGKGDFATIRVLVEAGADLEIKSKEGYTALEETCDDRVRAYLTEAVRYTCVYIIHMCYIWVDALCARMTPAVRLPFFLLRGGVCLCHPALSSGLVAEGPVASLPRDRCSRPLEPEMHVCCMPVCLLRACLYSKRWAHGVPRPWGSQCQILGPITRSSR